MTRPAYANRVVVGLVAIGVGLTAAACKREPQALEIPTRVVDAGVAKSPVDHLAPGELVEGTSKALGLVVPKIMTVDRAFDDVAFVTGVVEPDLVTKYVEARVREGAVKRTDEGQVFDKVKVPGESKILRIIVAKAPTGPGTRMIVRDVTPPSTVNTPPDEEARWRAVGLKPNGEPLDRTKLK